MRAFCHAVAVHAAAIFILLGVPVQARAQRAVTACSVDAYQDRTGAALERDARVWTQCVTCCVISRGRDAVLAHARLHVLRRATRAHALLEHHALDATESHARLARGPELGLRRRGIRADVRGGVLVGAAGAEPGVHRRDLARPHKHRDFLPLHGADAAHGALSELGVCRARRQG